MDNTADKHETMKLIKNNSGKSLDNFGYDDDFLDIPLKAQFIYEVLISWT